MVFFLYHKEVPLLTIITINPCHLIPITAGSSCFYPSFFLENPKAQTTLDIFIDNCQKEGGFPYLQELKIYKDQELVKTLNPGFDGLQTLPNLPYGSYVLKYQSIFGKTEQVSIQLSEEKQYELTICTDYLDYTATTYLAIIDQLQEGENYTINFASQGCFHSYDRNIVIYKKDKQYYLQYKKEKRKLNKKEIDALRNFEIELYYIQDANGGCTTTDSYTLTYQGTTRTAKDRGCAWSGFYTLLKQLALE